MSKVVIAIAVGLFALGVFVGQAISTAPDANAIFKGHTTKADQVVPFDLMVKSRGLPVEASAAF